MIQAQLHGKAPSELTWSEDILTSSVFGLLKYLSTPNITARFLSGAVSKEFTPLLLYEEIGDIEDIEYYFWPRLKRCEPDLAIVLHGKGGTHLVGVEAKYFSGKSNTEIQSEDDMSFKEPYVMDQLAKQLEDFYCAVAEGKFDKSRPIQSVSLVYLTLQTFLPIQEIQDSLDSLERNGILEAGLRRLYWLSWKSLYAQLDCPEGGPTKADQLIIQDLRALLARKDLHGFLGYNIIEVSQLDWTFRTSVPNGETYDWFSGLREAELLTMSTGGDKE
ncbi:hypothetical protein SAMN05444162_3093 [Paenibacillaceae bacterium GAS479]|nr:hypothetical protein SAMN05444162_3093 [Paenibacillaceae bacterium GAS479]